MASSAHASGTQNVDMALQDAVGEDVTGAAGARSSGTVTTAAVVDPAACLALAPGGASDGATLAFSVAVYQETPQQFSKAKSLAKGNTAGASTAMSATPVPSTDSAVPIPDEDWARGGEHDWARDAEEQWARAVEEQSSVATSTPSLAPTTAAAAAAPSLGPEELIMDLQMLEDAFAELLGASKALVEAVKTAHARFGVEYKGVDSESCGTLSLKQCTTLDLPRHTSVDSTLSAMDKRRVKAAVNRAHGEWGEAHSKVVAAASAVRYCYELAAQEEKVRERAEAILEKCKALVDEDEAFTAANDWSL